MVPLVLGGVYTFVSYNFPDRFIRHRNFIGEIGPRNTPLERQDSSFRAVAGLAGAQGSFSFESINVPNHYLRHQNWLIRLHVQAQDSLYRQDASFFVRQGRANAQWDSFESVNNPGRYIRHRNLRLYVEGGSSALFLADATFLPVRLG
jgi:hypothetical protein